MLGLFNILLKQKTNNIVILKNLIDGNFENGLTGWSNIAGNTTTNTTSTDDKYTGLSAFKSFATVPTAISKSIIPTTGSIMYLCGYIKCTRRVAGNIGYRLREDAGTYNASIATASNVWTFKSVQRTFAGAALNVDVGTFNSANADSYQDCCFVFNISDAFKGKSFVPTQAKIDSVLQAKIAAEGYKTEYKFKLSEFK
jgi:hypothetical protein